MTHIAVVYFSMVIAPILTISAFYWLVNGASRIIETHQARKVITRRLNSTRRQ